MIKDSSKVTMRGTVEPGGKLRLDGPVPVKPGPVDVTVRPVVHRADGEKKARTLLDMAGVGAKLWQKIDVDRYIRRVREEWDK